MQKSIAHRHHMVDIRSNIMPAIHAPIWKHSRTTEFHGDFIKLPTTIQQKAREVFHQLKQDPSLTDFRRTRRSKDIWRITISSERGGYRAVARRSGNHFAWCMIGNHDAYHRHVMKCKV